MGLGPKTFIGIGLAGLLALALVFGFAPRTAPPLVHVPAEQLLGRAGGGDVVHALQDIVEARADGSGEAIANLASDAAPDLGDLERDAQVLFAQLEGSDLSDLAQLQLRQAWDSAETVDAQLLVLSELRAALGR